METKLPSSQADLKTISLQSDNIAGDQPSPTTAEDNNGEDDVDKFFSKSHVLLNHLSMKLTPHTIGCLISYKLHVTSTIDPDTLQNVPLCSCFAIVDKESQSTDP